MILVLKIGIDVGSTYTKYCVMDENHAILSLFNEKTPIRQKEYFERKIYELRKYYDSEIEFISCGYGKNNIEGIKAINELTALAKGTEYLYPEQHFVLDIGGQDTKLIRQENGKLKEFFLNDKCAAGSGLFLGNVVNMLNKSFEEISLVIYKDMNLKLSSVCAVFAQSEIIELVAKNVAEDVIFSAVVSQIITQAKVLLSKVTCNKILLSGGMVHIPNVREYAENILEKKCLVDLQNGYLSAIGCALEE